jgi:hypothetical protein
MIRGECWIRCWYGANFDVRVQTEPIQDGSKKIMVE